VYKNKLLISEEQIRHRIAELAETLNQEYEKETLDIVCVLKGAVMFASDLIRHLKMDVRLHFLQAISYSTGTESSETVNLHFTSVFDIRDCHVLLVEDILDTGITMDYLVKHLIENGPESIKICVLLDKPDRRKVNIQPDYVGFQIPDEFVIGYGLDYQELGRNLQHIAVLDRSEYEK
jgi:hypoxanthine phosphoribosyltransferase